MRGRVKLPRPLQRVDEAVMSFTAAENRSGGDYQEEEEEEILMSLCEVGGKSHQCF